MKRTTLVLLAALAASPTAAQSLIQTNQVPPGLQQFADANGAPYAGGRVYFYIPNTTTPKTTWKDPYEAAANTNPVTLDASGRAAVWGNGLYREVLQDTNGVTVWDQLVLGGQTLSTQTLYPSVTPDSPGATSANSSAINAAIQSGKTGKATTVVLPCGDYYIGAALDNNVPNVLVTGCGTQIGFGINLTVPPATGRTKLLPTFAGDVLKHRTPYPGTTQYEGGGFVSLWVDGNGQAGGGDLLLVDSVSRGNYALLLTNGLGTETAKFTSCTTGAAGLVDKCSVQFASVDLEIQQGTGSGTNGALFTGSPNSNFSFNNVRLRLSMGTGVAAYFQDADNNIIDEVMQQSNGGPLVTMGCLVDGVFTPGGSFNTFTRLSGYTSNAYAIYAKGQGEVETGGTCSLTGQAVHNIILDLDGSNLTALPLAGPGATWDYYKNNDPSWNIVVGRFSYLLQPPNFTTAAIPACAAGLSGGVVYNTDTGLMNYCNTASWLSLAVNKSIIQASQFQASGTVPSTTGSTCATGSWAGGSTSGTFKTTAGCAGTNVVLGFGTTAPVGWACWATDMSTTTDRLIETNFSVTGATLTGTTAVGDQIVYGCTAF